MVLMSWPGGCQSREGPQVSSRGSYQLWAPGRFMVSMSAQGAHDQLKDPIPAPGPKFNPEYQLPDQLRGPRSAQGAQIGPRAPSQSGP